MKKNSLGYNKFKAKHKCPINHKGSAGAMKVEGVKKMFNRSIATNNIRYTTYPGADLGKKIEGGFICRSQ